MAEYLDARGDQEGERVPSGTEEEWEEQEGEPQGSECAKEASFGILLVLEGDSKQRRAESIRLRGCARDDEAEYVCCEEVEGVDDGAEGRENP